MENHLKRVLGLVRKTGDTMIVVDKDGQESFVVMDLDRYEMLLDAQMMDEDWENLIDEEIEETQDQPNAVKEKPEIWDVMPEAGDEAQTWDVDQLSQEEFAGLEKQYKAFTSQHVKEAIVEAEGPSKKIEASESASKKKDEDEYGEEQFYLEPVE